MGLSRLGRIKQKGNGQVLLLFAIALPVLIAVTALGVDFGFAYITRINLSKAVDAAALAAMSNINLGQSEATKIAQNAFNANFGSSMTGGAPAPVVTVSIGTNGNNNTTVNVSATATINTFFLHILKLPTLTIAANAQALRPHLIMSLVLDKSGSMTDNGGAQALPPAVINFLSYFDNTTDDVAEVSFSTLATVDVPIGTNFVGPVTSSVNRMQFAGGTYSQSGLLDGQLQINSEVVPSGEQVVKVAVFFTDGWANTINDTLNCNPGSTNLNYDGCAPNEYTLGWCGGIFFMNPLNGNTVNCGATVFPSKQYGTNETLNLQNVANEADYRALQVALSMQAQNVVVYSIGLGNLINQQFLQEIANDPSSPTYNSNLPTGEAVFAPTAADLQGVFQIIAAKILLRLSQ